MVHLKKNSNEINNLEKEIKIDYETFDRLNSIEQRLNNLYKNFK